MINDLTALAAENTITTVVGEVTRSVKNVYSICILYLINYIVRDIL